MPNISYLSATNTVSPYPSVPDKPIGTHQRPNYLDHKRQHRYWRYGIPDLLRHTHWPEFVFKGEAIQSSQLARGEGSGPGWMITVGTGACDGISKELVAVVGWSILPGYELWVVQWETSWNCFDGVVDSVEPRKAREVVEFGLFAMGRFWEFR